MIHAPTPPNEAERMEDLRALRLLDTPPERRFDRLVGLAARVFNVPMSYIALVDSDRQWFKAKCGIGAQQTGRSESFCGHTILRSEPLIVSDATRDERFHDNPLVRNSPHIRFYAGYPVRGPNGHNVGTLCLASSEPRELQPSEVDNLREFAELTERELQLVDIIRTQHELIETKDELLATQERLAQELADAAEYVQSLLPAALRGAVETDWQYVSSSQLGGDLFGYEWLDQSRLMVYLLDVSGHGVAASLLSISVDSALRRRTLPGVRFDDPGDVLTALNRTFPMEQNNGRFFTIWYGVFDVATRELRYASAGHPPALAFDPAAAAPLELGGPAPMIGALPDVRYETHVQRLSPGVRVYVFSDGAYEVELPDGSMLEMPGLARVLADDLNPNGHGAAAISEQIRKLHGRATFTDDFSLLKLRIR